MSTRVLVTGSRGMLARHLLAQLGDTGVGLDHQQLDISDPSAAASLASGELGAFDWVVNCAAYTAVDRAEHDVDRAYAVNAVGPGLIAGACGMAGIRLIHISTDYVFDGKKGAPYLETDPTHPRGVYAKSKLVGEESALSQGATVLRTSWLYGDGPCFPKSILRAARAGQSLRVVNDQWGTPTYAGHLAKTICNFIRMEIEPGLYHAAGAEVVTWYQLALRVLHFRGLVADVKSIATADWPTDALRPAYSALDSSKLGKAGALVQGRIEDGFDDV